MNKRMPEDKLLIGAYILQPYAQTEQHIKELAECGVEMVVCLNPKSREILDLLEKYGVGCILTGYLPHWWGGDGSNAGTMSEKHPLSVYEKAAKEFEDHPAIWGLDICDEPSALDFDHLGKIARYVENSFPNQFSYINLYPNYAAVAKNNETETINQLGTHTYEEHIKKYLEKIDLPYISYDFYLYPQTKNHNVGKMLDNFRIVSDACKTSGKDFWYIPMCNGRYENDFTSENMLRYQAYISLCYGATVINWACYTGGWWFNNILDTNGNKTEQYDKLKNINAELHRFGDIYMKYKTVDTYLMGFECEKWAADFPNVRSVSDLNLGFVRELKANGAQLVIGRMTMKDDKCKNALLICNASDTCDECGSLANITFKSYGRKIDVFSAAEPISLSSDGDSYSISLPSNRGIIVTFE